MKWEEDSKTAKRESLFEKQMRISWEFDHDFIIESMTEEQLNILEEAMKKIKALKK